jgi:hypothetical protein
MCILKVNGKWFLQEHGGRPSRFIPVPRKAIYTEAKEYNLDLSYILRELLTALHVT